MVLLNLNSTRKERRMGDLIKLNTTYFNTYDIGPDNTRQRRRNFEKGIKKKIKSNSVRKYQNFKDKFGKDLPGRPKDLNDILEHFVFALIPCAPKGSGSTISDDIDSFLSVFFKHEAGNLEAYEEFQLELRGVVGCPAYQNVTVLLSHLVGGTVLGIPYAKEMLKKYCKYFFSEDYNYCKRATGQNFDEMMDFCGFRAVDTIMDSNVGLFDGDITKFARITFMLEYIFGRQVCEDVYKYVVSPYTQDVVPDSYYETINQIKDRVPIKDRINITEVMVYIPNICQYLGMTKYGETLLSEFAEFNSNKLPEKSNANTELAYHVVKDAIPDFDDMSEEQQSTLFLLAYCIVNAGTDHFYNFLNICSVSSEKDPEKLKLMGFKPEEKQVKEEQPKTETDHTKELKRLRNEIKDLKKQILDKNSKIARQKEKIDKLLNPAVQTEDISKTEIVEEVTIQPESKQTDPVTRPEADIPFLRDKKIAIVGGMDSWVATLKEMFPGWIYLKPGASSVFDGSTIANVDGVFVYYKFVSHAATEKFRKYAKDHNIPFGFLNNSNQDLIFSSICETITEKAETT